MEDGWGREYIETMKELKREKEKIGEKKKLRDEIRMRSRAPIVFARVSVCVCVYVEQQSKDPHNLKFKFQQFT